MLSEAETATKKWGGGAHVLNVKLWGCGNEMILYFSVQLVEQLGGGGGGGAEPPQSEKWEGLSPPAPPPYLRPWLCIYCFTIMGVYCMHANSGLTNVHA